MRNLHQIQDIVELWHLTWELIVDAPLFKELSDANTGQHAYSSCLYFRPAADDTLLIY